MDLVVLLVSLGLILAGAELFTNGIEWFGHKLKLAEGAVGSVLAAVATAMPETLIPVIAILGPLVTGEEGGGASEEVGVGAILGAPFMLATLAMFVTGVAVIFFARGGGRTTELRVNVPVLARDVLVFFVAYALAIAAAFIPPDLASAKIAIAVALVLGYGLYVRAHFADEMIEGDAEELSKLHLTRLPGVPREHAFDIDILPGDRDTWEVAGATSPRLRIIVVQVVAALALILVGARVFVGAVEQLSTVIGLDERILALIIAPIATELPEKFNSVLWVRTGKDTLAMGNITGAMVFQSCLPTVIGLLFTPWAFTASSALSFASAGAAFIATAIIFGGMFLRGRLPAWTLLAGGPIYLAYVAAALILPAGVAGSGH